MAETQTPRRSRGRPRTFDRERAARTALALVDREGLAALTMRRLARELGMGTMSLYRHFRDKDELLDAVVDLASREGIDQLALRGDWQARVRTLARALYDSLTRHPGLVQVRLSRPMLSPGALRLTDIAMQVLLDAGFSPRQAAHAYRALFLYTFGCAAFDGESDPAARVRLSAAALTALPADEHPAIARSIPALAETMDSKRHFERGIAMFIKGLEAELPDTRG
jgi:AcrR family transcriptional regulator